MLCISVEETQKGKHNSVTHHGLINLLIERSLRNVSPMTWDEFVQIKTLKPQVSPSEQPSEENVAPTSELPNKTSKRLKPKSTKKMCKKLLNLLPKKLRGNKNCQKKFLFKKSKSRALQL